ncbi:SOS response-associated peptidase [Microvirga roseola]|uniref:SOS response-associated peptidase n=1 Tax=Microvirga roseola TaxID=2883126 RepID=UPI001E6351F0|nr:SOS response-associated peptidase [Microvirga roseola]
MCGRVIQYRTPEEYAASLSLSCPDDNLPNIPAHFNGAPGHDFLVIRRDPETKQPVFSTSQWGFIPSGAAVPKIRRDLVSVPAETVVTTDNFRAAYRYRRCLIPVDGFYEWKKVWSVGRQPYAIGMEGSQPFTLAGLWENWKRPDGAWVRTFVILTTQSNKLLSDLHNRMPLIIEAKNRGRWISEEEHSGDLLKPHSSEGMIRWQVSTQVNSPKNNDRILLEPLPAAG